MTPTREQVREQLVEARDAAYAAYKATPILTTRSLDAFTAYVEAQHALNRHDAPYLVALMEPLPSQQPEPTQETPHDAE